MAYLNQRCGTLGTQTGTGVGDTVNMDGWDADVLYIQILAGGSTIQIEQSIDGGANWWLVFAFKMGTGTIITTNGSADALWRIDRPAGLYRTNIPTTFVGNAVAFYKIGSVEFE